VISIAVGEGGPDAPPNEGFNEVQKLFGGIEQEGAILGDSDAPVLVTVYNDLRCLPCADYEISEIDPLIETYARTGRARFEFSHFSLGPESVSLAALAATAAGEQGRQWQYLDLMLRNLSSAGAEADDEFLVRIAEIVPELDLDTWEDDRASTDVQQVVEDDSELATELRLEADPAVIVSGPGGERRLERSPQAEEIEAAIQEAGG
jgi:protein-disulfide isomerase